MEDELRFHLENQINDYMSQGLSCGEAELRALARISEPPIAVNPAERADARFRWQIGKHDSVSAPVHISCLAPNHVLEETSTRVWFGFA
jgi:hypothetical protein